MTVNNSKIDWKRLWQLVSGIQHETPTNVVAEELLGVTRELQEGLLQFKRTNSSKTKLEDLLKKHKQDTLLPLTLRLQELLELESEQCWDLLCYYLTNEYRGISASSLNMFLSSDSNMTKLLDDIWGYYTLERIILLKIVKNLLTFYKSHTHPYAAQYKQIIEKISLSKLRESYIAQLEHLINEAAPSKLVACEYFNYQTRLAAWSERNAREIIEIVHILLLLCEHEPFQLEQIKRIFGLFKQHSFGKQQPYFDKTNNTHKTLLTRMRYSEVALFIKCIELGNNQASKTLGRELIAALNEKLEHMYNNEENGALFLAWMILHMRVNTTESDEITNVVRVFGARALKLNCFEFLHKLVSNVMVQDDSLLAHIVRKTIYNLLNHLCDYFDADGSCGNHAYIYELLSELLSWSKIAKDFCDNEDSGVRSLYNTLLERFPLKFEELSLLAKSLTKAGMSAYIRTQLETLPIYTDYYDDSKYKLKATGQEEYVLTHNVKPFPQIDFLLPIGTTVAVITRADGVYVHFRVETNYFNVLQHEINCLLSETSQMHIDYNSNRRVRRVDAGLQYLNATLQRIKTRAGITVDMVHPTEMCIDLLNKFKGVQNPPVPLLANCLNVCTTLLPLVETEIFTRVINLNMLPCINNDGLADYKKYAAGVSFDSSLVGAYLVDYEKKSERYDFLVAYLGFLRAYTKLQRNKLFLVEIPGLVFLLREVYPHMHAWRFAEQTEKQKIYTETMSFIADILNAVIIIPNKNVSDADMHRRLLRDICVYSLLNLENGVMLLRFVAVGNAYLQHTMEMETNWMPKQPHIMVNLVRLSMRILMQLLMLKRTIYETNEMSPLEALIYTQPKQRDTLRIIPVVTSYMCNIFDRWLPILSCRLLKRIALEFNMSLLACLDMEPDQIRMTFLQKLADEYENDQLKIALLELVEACINKQPGITEAFFKVNCAQRKRLFADKETQASPQIAASIVTYLEDYLEAEGKDASTVRHVLPSKIMNLFHSLWKQNMQILIEDLTKKPNFWQHLCNPLFCELPTDVRAFSQLFNIIAIEIYRTQKELPTSLKEIVLKFFSPAQMSKWLEYIFTLPAEPAAIGITNDLSIEDEMPEWLCRLQAFKGFLIILLKKKPQLVEIPAKQLKVLAEKCLTVLVERAKHLEDLRPFIILAEMYLVILLSFKVSYTENASEDRQMLAKLLDLLNRLAFCYEDMHVRAKEACISMAIRSTVLLADEIANNSTNALNFLNSVVEIICSELQNLENCVRVEQQTKNKQQCTPNHSANTLILCLNLLKTVAIIFQNDGPDNWDMPFIANKIFQRLLSCCGAIVQLYNKQQLSVELLDVLIVLAKGNCSSEFLHCDVGDYLWLKLLPPKELLQASYDMNKKTPIEWTVQKWWPIYARGIELVTVLFQKHTNHFLKEALLFVGIHEQYLIDSLLLSKQSLEPHAMELIKNAIMLLVELVNFEKEWRLEHTQSLFNLMRAVQILLGHCISMFHQPKTVRSLITGRRTQLQILQLNERSDLGDDLITAFNDLTEIIVLCARCLQRFSPKLIELLCEPQILLTQWEPIFEITFGAPKLNENALTLTLGTVLSIVSIYVKVLNLQNHAFHEIPLNELPNGEICGQQHNATTRTPATAAERTFSKSLSFNSATSTACPSNELLNNLDADLCLHALEHILMLVASQSLLLLKSPRMPAREKQLMRREISSELLSFHEFVKKKVLTEQRGMWHRRKFGQIFMQRNASDESDATQFAGSERTAHAAGRHSSDLRNSMRVNVVRRLHLQHQQQQQQQTEQDTGSAGAFEMSHVISPISGGQTKQMVGGAAKAATTSTPQFARAPLRRHGDEVSPIEHSKRATTTAAAYQLDAAYAAEEDEEIDYMPPEDNKLIYSPLSYVQLVEEDYLHFMSNLFVVICHSD